MNQIQSYCLGFSNLKKFRQEKANQSRLIEEFLKVAIYADIPPVCQEEHHRDWELDLDIHSSNDVDILMGYISRHPAIQKRFVQILLKFYQKDEQATTEFCTKWLQSYAFQYLQKCSAVNLNCEDLYKS